MKWEDLRRSTNVEDRRGQSSSPFGRGGGNLRGGGSGIGSLLQLLLFMPGKSKFLIIGLLLLMLFGGGIFGGLGGGNSSSNSGAINGPISSEVSQQAEGGQPTDAEFNFASSVLASTEDFWNQQFQAYGETYNEPSMVIYEGGTNTSGCGYGSSQVGPFYCPADDTIYIDLSFWRELSNKYGAPGDFAMAYVISHEVGHHVQNELGIMDSYNQQRSRLSQRDANELNVRLELQADYFAGAWARYAAELGILEEGDIEEALQAAYAVGDDTIQERAYGHTVPDSFTHGTAEQRQSWFMEGFKYADFEHADTFNRYLDFE